MRWVDFVEVLISVYLLYEPAGPPSEARRAAIADEVERFVNLMYEVEGSGSDVLDAEAFDRAAHQHPLLVQAFQLERLEDVAAPGSGGGRGDGAAGGGEAAGVRAGGADASSPLGEAALKARNEVYLGLRPGAVSRVDEGYFGGGSGSNSPASARGTSLQAVANPAE